MGLEEFDILKNLIPWMKNQPIKYPWQINVNAYRIWVSEVMLQQTVVTTVVDFFNRWMERFPSIFDLAGAEEEEVLRIFEGLGYYSRARNMHRCAKVLVEQYGGNFPQNYKELLRLPGIGDYTARAILSFAYEKNYLLVDANVKRVLRRVILQTEWTLSFERRYVNSLLSVSSKEKRCINEGIMRLGQEVCLITKPLCLICPLNTVCLAQEQGRQDIVSLQKREITQLTSRVFLLIQGTQVFLKKGDRGRFKGFYIFPKVDLKETVSLDLLKIMGYHAQLGDYTHTYTRFKESLQVVLAEFPGKQETFPVIEIFSDGGGWVDFSLVDRLPLPSIYRKIWSDFLSRKKILLN